MNNSLFIPPSDYKLACSDRSGFKLYILIEDLDGTV